MTNIFFERYRSEICRGLHKWCCERNLRCFRSFRAKKFFSKIGNFLTFFAYPGSQISWKMTNYFFERYRPEICCGLHKCCCERILRCFRSFWGIKKISKVASFLTFFLYPGSQISWKMTNYFFERYRPEICCGLHKWCCEQILRRFRLFRGKKFFFWKFAFFDVFCISLVTDFLNDDQLLFWEIPAWNLLWTAQMVLRTNFKAFKVVSSAKKNFSKIGNFLTFFAYPGSQISWKMTNFFFERYRPEICCGLHKWYCERILRHLRLFRGNKNFFKNWKFFDFFAYPGSQICWKMTNFFFERYRPEICRGLHKWCSQRILRRFRLFGAKNFFLKIRDFLTFFACPGSQISWKMTNFFFERYRPEICRGLQKWCSERILRRFRLFREKIFFLKIRDFLTFFACPGSQISWKMTNYFFERYRPEICCGLHKWCCERILRCFRSFRGGKKFPRLPVFDFFCISGVTDFLKND